MSNPPKYYDIKINVVHINDCVTHLIKPCKCYITRPLPFKNVNLQKNMNFT